MHNRLVREVRTKCPNILITDPYHSAMDVLTSPERSIICEWKAISEKKDNYISFKAKCTDFFRWFEFGMDDENVRIVMLKNIAKQLGISESNISCSIELEKDGEYYLTVRVKETALRLAYPHLVEEPETFSQKFYRFFSCCAEKEKSVHDMEMQVPPIPYVRMEMKG